MRVRIVCYEDVDAWILGKFARRMNNELRALSVDSDIAKVPDPNADINHHIIYYDYDGRKNSIDTIMITHIDSIKKVNMLKKQLESAEMGICMSSETLHQLTAAGLPREKLCYVSPAHDNIIKPRKIVIGITSKIHDDGRKKQNMLLNVAENIRPDDFLFKIMGKGWQTIVDAMRTRGFTVEYYSDFDYDVYTKLVPSFDYFLYFSFDEGSMGYIDALAAGVKTIVSPQGFHLDAPGGITYPIRDQDDVVQAFTQIAEQKMSLVRAVSDWTWDNYTRKHLEIWEYLLSNRDRQYLSVKKGSSLDGLSSISNGAEPKEIEWHAKARVKIGLIKSSLFYVGQSLKSKQFLAQHAPQFAKNIYARYFRNFLHKK